MILQELAALSDQHGVLDDLDYFLSTPDALKKNPCLILIPTTFGFDESSISVQGFSAAVLLFEYKILGMGSLLYASADTTGRRAVIASPASRARAAAYAGRYLVEKGAQVVLSSIHHPGPEFYVRQEIAILRGTKTWPERLKPAKWSLVMRENPLYLPLAATYDQTLATIGKKTRTNLRYYRRRAEKELGSNFVATAKVSIDEFLEFNRECSFAVPDDVARWRYESLSIISHPFLQGVQDGNGRWLSLASGRRTGVQSILEWQCNRADLPAASLSTVMRSYLIEHEISLGMSRLYFEGGTPSSLQQSFVVESAADLTVYRQSPYAWLIRKLARRMFPAKNYMAQILSDEKLVWTRI